MTHTSPTTFAVWSVLSTALGAFLLGHLYRFDKFKCLKWSNAPYSGAFKRIMTYTYLITIPLIMIYSFGFAYIKYKEGFIDVGGTILPKPYTFWSETYRKTIFPLMMVFAFAWSFEMITHLEELCFWYFLITAGPAQPDWFHSPYFHIWISGSVAAIIYLPVVTIVYRDSPLSCEARMFTAGSVGDLVLTLAFIPILLRFPTFIRKVKAEGVDSSVIVRLRKFYELNVIRIIFRFLMQIPLLMLGIDGVKPHTHELNESLFWTDLLSTVAALGCVFSSVCTLLIFFPRSYEAEYHAKEASHRRSINSFSSRQSHEPQPAYSQYGDDDFDQDDNYNAAQRKLSSDGGEHYNYEDDDFAKYERTERKLKMGTGLVRERFSSKLRERERRIAKSTRRLGAGLQDALSRRLMRLSTSMPKRNKRYDGESSAVSFSLAMPALSLNRERPDQDVVTRRTTPSARSAVAAPRTRKRSDSTAVMSADAEEGAGAGGEPGATKLERKGTYLLTDSPVLRARRMQEQFLREEAARAVAAAASVETLEAAYEAGAGAAARAATGTVLEPISDVTVSTSPIEISENDLGCGLGSPSGYAHAAAATSRPSDEKKDEKREIEDADADADVDAFALDLPPPPPSSTVPSYSQATGLSSFPGPPPPSQSPPTAFAAQNHVHGPRPIKKSSSVSTTATVGTGTRRALPTPPVAGDPLGAAPAYYPPGSPPQDQAQIQTRDEKTSSDAVRARNNSEDRTLCGSSRGRTGAVVGNMSTHPFASATAPLDRRETTPPLAITPRSRATAANANTGTGMRETNDATLITIQPRLEGAQAHAHATSRHPYARANAVGHATPEEAEMGTASGTGGSPGLHPPQGPGMGLTRANLARLNSSSSRTSQVNPLVKTFTSPIDFLDRIQENAGSRSGSGAGAGGGGGGGGNGNASRSQIGWAV